MKNVLNDFKILLTPADASEALSISPRKLWSLTAGGEIPCVRIGRSVRYCIDDLRAYVQRNRKGGAK